MATITTSLPADKDLSVKQDGTHNGSFHCDEALGCFMIRLTNKFNNAHIVRTRDQQILDTLDAVLDVGGVYDPSRDRYDHHQKGFDEVLVHGFNGFTTKLSSAGLVYKAIDAINNGINQYDTDQPPKYVNNTNLTSRVARLNLDWTDPDQSAEKENERAMALAGSEFLDVVRKQARFWLPARSIVLEALTSRKDVHPSGEIVVVARSCHWKLHLFELEQEMNIDPPIKFVLFQDNRSKKEWDAQAVSISPITLCKKKVSSGSMARPNIRRTLKGGQHSWLCLLPYKWIYRCESYL